MMCTAVSFKRKDHYFGRNMDFEYPVGGEITITPRLFPFKFCNKSQTNNHYAMIGMARIENDYPLYFEATNEKGLSAAGLYFPENAYYPKTESDKVNVAPYEFIPWVLTQCATVKEAKKLLQTTNVANINFSEDLKVTPLHWIVADKNDAITIEPMKDGLKILDNKIGILTNNPPFDYHMVNLVNYMSVTRQPVLNRFSSCIELEPYSRGMGTIGLPGDYSSASRFVRAAFVKLNSECEDTESASLSQFYHILNSVNQQKGCCQVGVKYEYTLYSSCCNTDKGIYYYNTYENSQISGVNMYHCNLDSNKLIRYAMIQGQQINMQN